VSSSTLGEREGKLLLRGGGITERRLSRDIRRRSESRDTWRLAARERDKRGFQVHLLSSRIYTRLRSRKMPVQCGPSVASAIELSRERRAGGERREPERAELRVVAWSGTGFESRISLNCA
jgi:hypothetical protein